MNASISGIYDRGVLDKERVHFRADVTLNLSFYVLINTTETGINQVSAGNVSGYWFAPKPIARGEHFVVYTRAGAMSTETRADGSVYHFFFRGLPAAVYSLPQMRAVLMEVGNWASTKANPTPLQPLLPLAGLGGLPSVSALGGGLAGSPLSSLLGIDSFNAEQKSALGTKSPLLGDYFKSGK